MSATIVIPVASVGRLWIRRPPTGPRSAAHGRGRGVARAVHRQQRVVEQDDLIVFAVAVEDHGRPPRHRTLTHRGQMHIVKAPQLRTDPLRAEAPLSAQGEDPLLHKEAEQEAVLIHRVPRINSTFREIKLKIWYS